MMLLMSSFKRSKGSQQVELSPVFLVFRLPTTFDPSSTEDRCLRFRAWFLGDILGVG